MISKNVMRRVCGKHAKCVNWQMRRIGKARGKDGRRTEHGRTRARVCVCVEGGGQREETKR